MSNGNLKMALVGLRSARWRSLLTMSGIIVGVLAVITTVSIGQGVKRQLTGQVAKFNKTTVTVTPGVQDDTSVNSVLSTGSLITGASSGLNAADLATVQQTPHVSQVVPLAVSSSFASVDGQRLPGGTVLATSDQFANVINHPIEFGAFFTALDQQQTAVVIGNQVATQLFDEQSPIGRTLQIRGQNFTVRGVFSEFSDGFLPIGADLNRAVFIPYAEAQTITNGSLPITEIFTQVDAPQRVVPTIAALRQNLSQAHGGQADFTVLRAADQVRASSRTVNLLTQMITGIAAVSLLVGGLGIINIMLVSVTERTREIGIRKAIGATNRQILNQFLIEAAVLSVVGGLIGVLLALLVNYLIILGTDLHPVLSLPVILLAPLAAWFMGIVFGVIPAVKAAHKDPIEALRYE